MTIYSRAAWETFEDFFWAVEQKLMEPPPAVWGSPNNPWVIVVHKDNPMEKIECNST